MRRTETPSPRATARGGSDVPADASSRLLHDIAALDGLDITALRCIWQQRLGGAPPPIQSADFLRRLIAWKLQARLLGGLDRETGLMLTRHKRQLAQGKPLILGRVLGLPPGTVLTRVWRGRPHTVTVLDQGFEHQGRLHRSLTAVARAITGTAWSGPRFFGLAEEQLRSNGAPEP